METFVAIAGSLTVLTLGVVIAVIEAIFRACVRHSAGRCVTRVTP
jgi:hypothetical protein